MTTMQQTALAHEPTLVELVTGIVASARDLALAHAAQLQAEVRREALRLRNASLLMTAGMVFLGIGLLFLMVAITAALIALLAWPAWVAWLVVAMGSGIAGAVLVLSGRQTWGMSESFLNKLCNLLARVGHG